MKEDAMRTAYLEKKPKRKAADSVFIDLFRDKKYLLQLYQALHPEDERTKEDDLTIVTIKNILTEGMYNDLGFLVEDKLILLVESQTKWTVNILVRALMYLIQTYHDYLIRTNQDIHGTKKVNLPRPEMYIIYIGDRKARTEYISFAEEFFKGNKDCFDAKIKVIYDGMEGDIINQYVIFTKVFKEQMQKHHRTHKAILETIRICKDRNILRDYLSSRESEVVDIMMTLFNDEEILDMYVRSQRREVEEANFEAMKKKAKKMIVKGKLTIEELAEYFPEFSDKDIKEIEKELMQMV